MAAKTKLVFAINNDLSLAPLDRNRFHRLLAIRHAFAHNDVLSGFEIDIPEDLESPIGDYVVMESIKGDGSIERLRRDTAFEEFYSPYEYVKTTLQSMLAKLRG